jgi:hypothetical protein
LLLDAADTTTVETPDGISVLCTVCGERRLAAYGIDPDSSSEGKADGTLGGDPFPVEFVRGAFLFGDGGHFLVRCVTAARKRTGSLSSSKSPSVPRRRVRRSKKHGRTL